MARGRGELTPKDIEIRKIISTNINKLLEQYNKKQTDIHNATGIPKSTLTGYIKGTSTPNQGNIQKISDFFGVKKSDIDPRFSSDLKKQNERKLDINSIYAQLSPPRQQKVYDFAKHELEEQQESEQKNKVQSLQKYREMKEQTEEFADIEWYGCASAGTGEFIFDNKEVISLPKKRIPLEADFCLTVNGDSMEPIIHDQDYIFVSKQDTLFNGNIGVVIVDGEAFIKKVFFENDKARLQSFNKKYKDIIVDDSNDFRIIGKVVM
ncbi:helix-turn-helix transcriptional regulator [Enterococcus hirae]|uniref:XRE family transcriptional regulator n=1 Tax=Enterococcus sp. AZ137 TaxID=2774965 RepID=UPI002EAA5554|nr:helix-turn-helix transcriptional regulator [Enterococcus hirae]